MTDISTGTEATTETTTMIVEPIVAQDQSTSLIQKALELANDAALLANDANDIALQAAANTSDDMMNIATAASSGAPDFFVIGLTVFALACFVGYYVVWRVTPALHSPLMAVTNAISSVIIVGALIAAGPAGGNGFAELMGFFAVILASINIFGGFIVTRRMLQMFKKKK